MAQTLVRVESIVFFGTGNPRSVRKKSDENNDDEEFNGTGDHESVRQTLFPGLFIFKIFLDNLRLNFAGEAFDLDQIEFSLGKIGGLVSRDQFQILDKV